jgi:endonuclease YncB( thermonuclease family)
MKKIVKQFHSYATILRHIDGDTVAGVVDKGDHQYCGNINDTVSIRLDLIDTPELHSTRPIEVLAASRSFAKLKELLPVGTTTLFESTASREKYGRFFGKLKVADQSAWVHEAMIALGYAKPYHGEKKNWTDAELQKIIDIGSPVAPISGGTETTTAGVDQQKKEKAK